MIEYNRHSWWATAFSLRGTALPCICRRVGLFTIYSAGIQFLYETGLNIQWFADQHFQALDPIAHTVLGSLIGFLIVFRMNTSNQRYWDGRGHWGQLTNASRNLARFGSIYTTGGTELSNLIAGYVICIRSSLQGKRDTEEADLYLPESVSRVARSFGNIPNGVSAAISKWINHYYQAGVLDSIMVQHLEFNLCQMVDAQGSCEKIQKTPLPFVYVAMIKQLILIYLATLPLVLCERCGWWSPLLILVVALGLFGLEEASVEIEDPFGKDANCLDMETYTLTIARDTGQLAVRKFPPILPPS
ncbi:MAG: bestrophin family ion channel [Planctomycetales bacterium]|nr:bestrophin family ion channel [Planctomycetales bacterium]